jgi:hypothetical protein
MESLAGATGDPQSHVENQRPMAEPGEEHSVARVKPAASKSQGKPKTERRQQQKHKKNVALHQICVKSEWVRRQE